LKARHKDSKAIDIDESLDLLCKSYGNIGKIKTNGKLHEYLGVKLDYTQLAKVIIYVVDYVKSKVKSLSEKDLHLIKLKTPWNNHLYEVRYKSLKVCRDQEQRISIQILLKDSSYASMEDQIFVLHLLTS